MNTDNFALEIEPADDMALEIEPVETVETAAPVVNGAFMELLGADVELPELIKFVPDLRLKAALDAATADAAAVVVTGTDGLVAADQKLGIVRERMKTVEAHFEDPTRRANALHKRMTGARADWLAGAVKVLADKGIQIITEKNRLDQIERDRIAAEQKQRDDAAREAAKQEAKQAECAGAPATVVQDLLAQAETATAAPVTRTVATPKLQNTAIKKTWKARLMGTSGDAEPQPSTQNLTAAQRERVMALIADIAAGQQPLACVELNWTYLDKRASADKSTLQITGIQAYEEESTRGKGVRK